MNSMELQRTEGQQVAPVCPPQSESSALMAMIGPLMSDPKFDADKLAKTLEIIRDLRRTEAKIEFTKAMRAAQEEMRPVVRDAENQSTRSRYARLETIDAKIRPIYTRHGFSMTFNSPATDANGVTVTCTVLHVGGHSQEYSLTGALDTVGPQGKANKTPVQGLGSALSYLQRYLRIMVWAIVLTNEDNDGNGSSINEHQVNQILDMFVACEMDDTARGRFLKNIVGVGSVEEIPAANFKIVMNHLIERQKVKGVRR